MKANNSPKISIIVPVYNLELYLENCIRSILSQTFTNFELLLINDGSTDGSGEICDKYQLLDSRVLVIHKKNAGVSEARNTGIRTARGTYIMFCDGDDCVESDWCQSLFDMIEENPLGYCLCNMGYIFIKDNFKEVRYQDTSQLTRNMLPSDYYILYKSGLTGSACNKIYLRSTIIQKKIFFSSSLSIGEDAVFNTVYFQTCNSIKYVDKPLYLYFHRENSASHSYVPRIMEQSLTIFTARLPYIDDIYLAAYCRTWLFRFIQELKGIFDKRNPMTLWQRLKYNQRMICTSEFQYCISHADCSAENPFYIRLLKSKNYYLVWLFDLLVSIKRRIFTFRNQKAIQEESS